MLARYSLSEFKAQFGNAKLAPFTNKETGEVFTSLVFIKGTNLTLVGFSSKMGELTAAQIAAQKDNLQIVQLESGTYKLCKKGESTWEDVDI